MKRFLYLILSLFFSFLVILLIPIATVIRPFLPFANYLLGVEKPTSYLILLGNDTEMRANGGFAGSYAKITTSLSPSTKHLALNTDFQDIYVPNGQLAGHVTPPEPIQQAFGHGTWELANADWEPDFPTAAQNIRWFLEKGKEINPDILALINLSTVEKILHQIGGFPVPEYDANLTPDNLYLFLQGKTETNFFPGSTQKKDTLTAVGHALIKKARSLSLTKKLQIAYILYTDLINQNIMIHSSNSSFQNLLGQKKLIGVLSPEAFDTYSLVETNLGANKANQFVSRSTAHTVTVIPSAAEESPSTSAPGTNNFALRTSTVHHQVTVHFTNSSPAANPNPPIHYGGNYITYLRFYIPIEARNISLTRDPVSSPPLSDTVLPTPFVISSVAEKSPSTTPSTNNSAPSTNNFALRTNYGLTEIGFWQTTPAGGESTISLSYNLPLPCPPSSAPSTQHQSLGTNCPYSLAILKQHGLVSSPQTINVFGKTYTTSLKHSFYYP